MHSMNYLFLEFYEKYQKAINHVVNKKYIYNIKENKIRFFSYLLGWCLTEDQ